MAAALAAPAWSVAQRHGVWFLWDYGTIVMPFAVWLGLSVPRSGYLDLANRIEPLILAVLIPGTLSLRVFLLDQALGSAMAMSIVTFAGCTFSAVGLWWAGRRRWY